MSKVSKTPEQIAGELSEGQRELLIRAASNDGATTFTAYRIAGHGAHDTRGGGFMMKGLNQRKLMNIRYAGEHRLAHATRKGNVKVSSNSSNASIPMPLELTVLGKRVAAVCQRMAEAEAATPELEKVWVCRSCGEEVKHLHSVLCPLGTGAVHYTHCIEQLALPKPKVTINVQTADAVTVASALQRAALQTEAEASVALDGETQSVGDDIVPADDAEEAAWQERMKRAVHGDAGPEPVDMDKVHITADAVPPLGQVEDLEILLGRAVALRRGLAMELQHLEDRIADLDSDIADKRSQLGWLYRRGV